MTRLPTPAGLRMLKYMASNGGVLLVQTTSATFKLTYYQLLYLLRGLERRGLILRTSGGWCITDLGRDELTGAAATRRRLASAGRGEANYSSWLSEADVKAIREAYEAGEYQHVLAAKYGVAQSTISDVVRRIAWKHVA